MHLVKLFTRTIGLLFQIIIQRPKWKKKIIGLPQSSPASQTITKMKLATQRYIHMELSSAIKGVAITTRLRTFRRQNDFISTWMSNENYFSAHLVVCKENSKTLKKFVPFHHRNILNTQRLYGYHFYLLNTRICNHIKLVEVWRGAYSRPCIPKNKFLHNLSTVNTYGSVQTKYICSKIFLSF